MYGIVVVKMKMYEYCVLVRGLKNQTKGQRKMGSKARHPANTTVTKTTDAIAFQFGLKERLI